MPLSSRPKRTAGSAGRSLLAIPHSGTPAAAAGAASTAGAACCAAPAAQSAVAASAAASPRHTLPIDGFPSEKLIESPLLSAASLDAYGALPNVFRRCGNLVSGQPASIGHAVENLRRRLTRRVS